MPLMLGMPLERAKRISMHPLHQEMVGTLAELISILRECRSHDDYYGFQQDLLERVLVVQEHRASCRRVAKRLRQGKAVPADAPELRSGEPVSDPESWELEADVCERVDRQLRSIADALAWRVFDYNRAVIIGLSRNQHPGPMVNKPGLVAEREFVTKAWHEERHFVLLHDLTSCLSIGDATLFKEVGTEYEAYLKEIKTNADRTVSRQARRKRMAEEAIRSGGTLPGSRGGRLVQLDVPYRTHVELLGKVFELARERGVQGVKVPGGRSLVATDIIRGYQLWPEHELIDRAETEHLQASKRARILGKGQLVYVRSDDLVARSPTSPPWAVYPLEPAWCARLITDYAFFKVTMASEPLIAALEDVGLSVEWVLDPGPHVRPGQAVARIHSGMRRIELTWAEVQRRLLLELADLPTWTASVKQLLAHDHLSSQPWQLFTDEWRVWR